MARSRGGSRPAPRAPARPAAARPAPPPATTHSAPAPAHHQQSSGGGLMSSIGSTIAQGMAFGGGSAVAHRAVDAVMGPRTVHAAPEAPSAAAEPAQYAGNSAAQFSNSSMDNACSNQTKSFRDCIEHYGDDISKCQFYADMLKECRTNSGSVL
ncbi:hypothetical protein KFL_000920290 [Klebsormidium nitens]|uniref:CHCH domain-containing protein n=1 Tax=Klebsormidium nitens TaxID=105231 RepID=A0A0U9HRP8_KLENI|nr:hypothetical protein KFL_000920290 [Klebsormidium nitens]|eukprot:GAQ81845.1 hypothetical protein KFL_000920290 [Klebsormidium nitens]